MLIAITGTPGTGKTGTAKIASRLLDANLISIKHLVDAGKIPYSYDRKRKTKVIDENSIMKAVRKELDKSRPNVVEGHLSHFMKADYIFVLRTNPKKLRERLLARGWSKEKINENVHAEFLDEIVMEAVGKNKRVFEIDTSRRKPHAAARLIIRILNNYPMQKKYRAGIDWTEKYMDFLIKLNLQAK